ncbi:MAG: tetratricopeptide repeat protein [Gloeomargarita sp. DG_2_bins_126]
MNRQVLAGLILGLLVAGCAPDTTKMYDEAVLALRQGRPNQAIEKLNQVIQLRPDYWPAYEQRGIAYLKLGEYQAAVLDLTKALEKNGNNPVILRHRAIAYFGMGKPAEGNADLCRAAALTRDTPIQKKCAERQPAAAESDNPG